MPSGTSNDELSQGARANVAGKTYEDMLINMFGNYGFEVLGWAEWRRRNVPLERSGKVAIKQFPYVSIYGHRGRTEWLIVNNDRDIVVRVEIKTQRSAGSVDEKLPYLYLNAAFAYKEDYVVLLIEGDGFKEGARKWLRDAVDGRWLRRDDDGRTILMMSFGEFVDHFIENLS